jgi:hypothetical protein
MKSRMLWLVGVLCGLMLASAMPAAAKSVPMRPMSRGAVDNACGRAGGSSFGTHDSDGSYGCSSNRGSVECAPDGTCIGFVSDLLRMPANSLDAVLGARVSGQPTRIGPADHRIMRRVEKP